MANSSLPGCWLLLLIFAVVVFSRVTAMTDAPDVTDAPDHGDEEEYGGIHVEYPPYDGWYNNRAAPSWGAADTQLLRRLPSAYSDGSYEPAGEDRPNPIEVSRNVFNGSTGMGSDRNATALLVFFGQQVVEEILDAQRPGCPPEYFNIKIPKGHDQYDPEDEGDKEMPFLRSRYDMTTGFSPNNPRQQLNEITPWLDGGLMYGPNKAWADALRSYKGGRLAAANDTDDEEGYFPALNDIRLPMANPPPPRDHKLKPISRFYKLGNPRGNENPFLLTMGIMWFRYHNYIADKLAAENPTWGDETLFNEARKWTIAVHQSVVIYDWLPSWLNEGLEPYSVYDPSIHPGITHVFQSAAMRFGHTMVPPGVYRRNKDCVFRETTKDTVFDGHRAVRTCNTYWNPQESVRESGIEEFIMGMASQIAEREDMIITPDLRGDVFGPLEFSRRDLMAINIQRGRDHGLPDYNTARVEYNLSRITEWEDINPALYNDSMNGGEFAGLFDRFKELYDNDLSKIDIWPGGMLETNKGPGELFRAIIKDQFRRIRDGDRFWFENNKINYLFTDEEIDKIRNTRLRDVIMATTDIPEDALQDNIFRWNYTDLSDELQGCGQPVQLSHEVFKDLAPCTPVKTFDYFSGSEASYALSFAALIAAFFLCIGLLLLLARQHDKQVEKQRSADRAKSRKISDKASFIPAVEWISKKDGNRNVRLKLDSQKKAIMVNTEKNKPLRTIDLSLLLNEGNANTVGVILSVDKDFRMMVLRIPKEYDLILQFDHPQERQSCMDRVRTFLEELGIGMESPSSQTERHIKTQSITREVRQKQLEKFFKAIFSHAFKLEVGEDFHPSMLDHNEAMDVLNCELTKFEFADSLALKPTSLFVENMFKLVDKDDNGYISFREFMDMFVIFHKGSADDKAALLFDMYDIDGTGTLNKDEFKLMLRSLLEMSNADVEDHKINDVVNDLFMRAGLSRQPEISLDDFQRMLGEYKQELSYASLGFEGAPGGGANAKRDIAQTRARKTIYKAFGQDDADPKTKRFSQFPESEVKTIEKEYPRGKLAQNINSITRFVENYKLHIFWVVLYTLICAGIFIERAYYYSIEREHAGLRRIAGYGVTVTRGAASGMMFTYSCLLVTMCRNTITFLRETVLHRFIPFDGAIAMHKYIAFVALFFTIMHCIGHAINFYHVSTQTANDLICLFRDFFHATDDLPKFHRWCWETLTGFTGVLATILTSLMYVFAIQYARRHAFRWFWFTHNMYPILFILMILHGAGRLVQPPFFHYFFLGPVVMFTIDKLITVSRNKTSITVLKAELLPSDVIYLEFKRPQGFEYKSGQWVRIACLAQGSNEYHPFTLASAPHEENLSLYIRAVGPWTMNLRQTYNPAIVQPGDLPKIYLDGAYGEGHQDWYRFEVAVLVGGGIGVTPFASILKDLVNSVNSGRKIRCKKVYFLWVTRTQKQFEWMTDIIREVEDKDLQGLVSVHIFITQFKQKFDIRTTMLYICERHFQKISDRSLFTGLRSITHFGRPDFESFFRMLLQEHSTTSLFGVFSCGPPPMTLGVEKTCSRLNKYIQNALFVHHYENF